MEQEELKKWIEDAQFNIEQLDKILSKPTLDVAERAKPFMDALKLSLFKMGEIFANDTPSIRIFCPTIEGQIDYSLNPK